MSMTEDTIRMHMDTWKRKLLDTSKKNNLIKYKYRKSKTLHVLCPNIDTISSHLSNMNTVKLGAYDEEKKDDVWQIHGTEKQIIKKLKNIFYTNRENDQEKGINNCYVGIFLLHYTEPRGDEALSAPLFLKKITLKKNGISSLNNYFIVPEENDIELNMAIKEKLKADHEIILPPFEQDMLKYLNDIEPIISSFGWYVTPFVIIDNFDYQKQMMYNDIEKHFIAYHSSSLIRRYCGIRSECDSDGIIRMNHHLDVKSVDVFPADSSQKEIIENAKKGKSMVVQGPPGTGKSQTISNIIISLISEGKKVLFVSQKRAALDVVYSKLKQAGVHGYCLRLHARDSKKSEIIADMMHQLRFSTQIPQHDINEISTYLQVQDIVNMYYQNLCERDPHLATSLYELRGILSKHEDVPALNVPLTSLFYADHPLISDIKYQLGTISHYMADMVRPSDSPILNLSFSAEDNELYMEFSSLLQRHDSHVVEYQSFLDAFTPVISAGLSTVMAIRIAQLCPLVREHKSLLQRFREGGITSAITHCSSLKHKMENMEEVRNEILSKVSPQYLEDDTAELEQVVSTTGTFGKFLNKRYKLAKEALGKYQLHQLHDNELEHIFSQKKYLQSIQRSILQLQDYIKETYPLLESGAVSIETVSAELEALRTVENIIGATKRIEPYAYEDFIDTLMREFDAQALAMISCIMDLNKFFLTRVIEEDQPFLKTVDTLSKLVSALPQLPSYLHARQIINSLPQSIQNFVDVYYRTEGVHNLDVVFEKSYYSEMYTHLLNANLLRSPQHEAEYLRSLDGHIRSVARHSVIGQLTKRKPQMYYDVPSSSISILKREHEKKRRHKPLRKLFEEISDVLFSIKPCFMMSPLAVCQYIKIEKIHFDVVIFDEASQIMPEDAASCLARAEQTIIVGDSQQLPPTSFFYRNDDEDEVIDMLDSFLKEGSIIFPELYLRWHYRSRDESLIAYSNQAYYGNDLITFPENHLSENTGISFVYVQNGVYDRGRSRKNRIEADRVVEIFEKTRIAYPDASIGIIAFSLAQEQAISDAFEKKGIFLDDLESPKQHESYFIKNLETVQGDERDIIILSVGYGKDAVGKLSYNFGPINREEGYKRLNVATTRSRDITILVSSISYRELDDSHISNKGTMHLKGYLRYAETGKLEGSTSVTEHLPYDSSFEEAVHLALQSRGHDVKLQVGCSGYRIDLAIKDPENPGRYLLGIECDGAKYHISKYARDRDRIRQGILEDLGWRIYRIWSDDWMLKKEEILDEIDELARSIKRTTQDSSHHRGFEDLEEHRTLQEVEPQDHYPRYESVYVPTSDIDFFDFINGERIPRYGRLNIHCTNTITKILDAEAPITKELLMRKTLSTVGVKRFTARTMRIFDYILSSYGEWKPIRVELETIFCNGSGPLCPVRISTNAERSFEQIPIQELAQAVYDMINSCPLEKEELIRAVPSSIYNYKRTGGKIRSRMMSAIKYLRHIEMVSEVDGKISRCNDP